MNVVVSAIVDPWVTTLSFVVALAMKIQAHLVMNALQKCISLTLFQACEKKDKTYRQSKWVLQWTVESLSLLTKAAHMNDLALFNYPIKFEVV